jgi:hypothetical protein
MSSATQALSRRDYLSVALAYVLAVQTLFGAPQVQAPTKLNIVIVEGEGAINNIRQRTAREPIVQVEDENHRPVAGAAVVFLLPENGPGGTFPNGARSLTVTTNQQGRAVARGFRPNNQAGKFQIQVDASYQDLTASTTISQANAVLTAAAAAGGISGKLIAILAIAGGAIAGGVVAATRGGGNNGGGGGPVSQPTTVSPGTPTVGGPR